jgi:hypothetical protein
MYQAIGNINGIYVVVEIGGYLYLTKGAAFSYHEFLMPAGRELNEADWVKMMEELKIE